MATDPVLAMKIYKNLPLRDCGECGVKLCKDFALFLSDEFTDIKGVDKCPYLEPLQVEAIVVLLNERLR
ncbi:Uncharacterised protein [uncultured archaeon]|nr:Uncharacterised protein [uncultured archaeon]